MKRTAAEYATLLGLLDEALDVPVASRAAWIEQLPGEHSDLRPTLRHLLLTPAGAESADIRQLPDQIAAIAREAATHDASPGLAAGEQVGPYELVRELGRGGMGAVWLARRADGAFERSVALKLPFVSWSGNLAERMARERDILASLEHPNIARFYDAGVDALGRPFIALEYVEGQPIDAFCRERRLSVSATLALVLQIARAVAFAHSKLVVHRDLKPGNVLVTADGEVRLLDFGLAKLLRKEAAPDARLTEFADRLMTPDYASPEQIKGEPIGTATDQYSLAVLSYELLTGARPYRLRRETAAELELAIAEADPRLASEVAADRATRARLRGDLDAILNKAMKKQPAERYASVDAFAADLQRHLNGDVVLARPDRAGYRVRKFVGRHRLALGATLIIVVALLAATSVSVWQAQKARREAATSTAMKNFLLQLFTAGDNRASGSKPPGETTVLELLDRGSTELLGSLDQEPAVKLDLIQAMADIYERLDADDKSLALYRAGVGVAERTFGVDSRQKAQLLANIASSQVFSGHWADGEAAVAVAERAFDAAQDHDSLAYAELLKIKGNIERRHGTAGLVKARATLEKSVALFERSYRDHEGYVGALMYLAGTYASLDEIPAAKSAVDKAVAQSLTLRNDEAEQAHAKSMRAAIDDQLGDFAAADRDYLEAARLYAATVGTKHFFYLQSENLHGQSLHEAGRRDEGLNLVRSTTAAIEAVRPDSNTLANSLARLTQVYLRDGAFDEAYRSATQGLAIEAARQSVSLHTRLLLERSSALNGLGRFDAARRDLDAASIEMTAIAPPTAYAQSEMAFARGEIAFAEGDLGGAQAAVGTAKSVAVAGTLRERFVRARILSLSARLALARHEPAAAARDIGEARALAAAADLASAPFLGAELLATAAAVRCAAGAADGVDLAEQALAARLVLQRPSSPLLAAARLDAARCEAAAGHADRAAELIAGARLILDTDAWAGPQYRAMLASASGVTGQ